MSNWTTVYDLAEDEETVRLVQRATLNTKDFGLLPDVALFGSTEWWNAIDDGRIPKHSVRGIISQVYFTGHGDWPQFELDSNGEKSKWTRLGDPNAYRVGDEVVLEYVAQRTKREFLGKNEQKKVIRVKVRSQG